jgi:hypothetical protein
MGTPVPTSRVTRATKKTYLYKKVPAKGNQPEKWIPFLSPSGSSGLLRDNVKNIIKRHGRNNIWEYNTESKIWKQFKGGRRGRTMKKRN